MSANDRFGFKPQVPMYELVEGKSVANNVRAIMDDMMTVSRYYITEVMFLKINFDVYTAMDPPGNASDWGEGYVIFHNKNYNFDQIANITLTTMFGYWAGRVYLKSNGNPSTLTLQFKRLCDFEQ